MPETAAETAAEMDARDEQPCYAHQFVVPTNRDVGADSVPGDRADSACTYLCGNSLGVLPRRSAELVKEELDVWATHAVEGHFTHPKRRAWTTLTDAVTPLMAGLIGARDREVACMGGLTSNLHLLMGTFYKPAGARYKILCESKAFPSDQYAFASQAALHGLDPRDAVRELSPRAGEHTLRESDILDAIRREGATIALVLFSGVQYYTGQCFPMRAITQAAHEQGCICGWDLAHAIGNVPLALHAWGVDFAVWCTYKYLNGGPGSIGGLFIHEAWHEREKPRLAGWWGHDLQTRFLMPPAFAPIPGAQGFQQSNPSALATVALLGALEVFAGAGGVAALRPKSVRLTGHLARLLRASRYFVRDADGARGARFTIITPAAPEARGAQLSLLFLPRGGGGALRIFAALKRRGVVGDERQPDVIRLSPAPLYNTFADCERAAEALDRAIEELEAGGSESP